MGATPTSPRRGEAVAPMILPWTSSPTSPSFPPLIEFSLRICSVFVEGTGPGRKSATDGERKGSAPLLFSHWFRGRTPCFHAALHLDTRVLPANLSPPCERIHSPSLCVDFAVPEGFEIDLAAEWADGGTELCEMKSAMSFAHSLVRFMLFCGSPDVSPQQGRAEARPSRCALHGEGRASARPLWKMAGETTA